MIFNIVNIEKHESNSNIQSISLKNSFYLILVTLILIYLLKIFVKFVNYSNIINKIPGPTIKNLLIGNIDIFYVSANTKHWFQKTYKTLLDLCEGYRRVGVFRLWIGPFNPVVVLMSAENIEILLSNITNIDKAFEYKYLRPWLGYGLLTSINPKWKTHRKLLTPAFHFKILENFLPTIVKQENIMLSLIDKQMSENEGIIEDIRPLITNYALDAICETAMGVTVSAQSNPSSDYVEAIRRAFAVSILRFIKPWLWTDFMFYYSSLGKFLRKRLAILHGFTDTVIKERKLEILDKIKEMNNSSDNSSEATSEAIDSAITSIGSKRRLVFLDLLITYHLKNPEKMSELDVRSEVDTFMFGGHDTTSSSLMFTLMLIGHDMNVQAKIHEELDEIFLDDMSREITVEDLRKIKYLEQCVKESLRLYPPIQIIGRQLTEPITLSTGQYLPKGSTCYVPLVSIHKDPKHFPNPEAFDPDRFSSESLAQMHPYAHIPYSAGARNCIGLKFASLEMKATLATIFRKYRIKTLVDRNDISIDLSIVLKPKTKLKMKFELRN